MKKVLLFGIIAVVCIAIIILIAFSGPEKCADFNTKEKCISAGRNCGWCEIDYYNATRNCVRLTPCKKFIPLPAKNNNAKIKCYNFTKSNDHTSCQAYHVDVIYNNWILPIVITIIVIGTIIYCIYFHKK